MQAAVGDNYHVLRGGCNTCGGYEIATIHDRAGRAANYYNRFADLWNNADPELQPAVRDVRAPLARLAREPGG